MSEYISPQLKRKFDVIDAIVGVETAAKKGQIDILKTERENLLRLLNISQADIEQYATVAGRQR